MTHNLKLCFEACSSVLNGDKSFDIRQDVYNFRIGDHIIYTPWDVAREVPLYHPIEEETFVITYMSSYKLEEGYVILSVKKIQTYSICDKEDL